MDVRYKNVKHTWFMASLPFKNWILENCTATTISLAIKCDSATMCGFCSALSVYHCTMCIALNGYDCMDLTDLDWDKCKSSLRAENKFVRNDKFCGIRSSNVRYLREVVKSEKNKKEKMKMESKLRLDLYFNFENISTWFVNRNENLGFPKRIAKRGIKKRYSTQHQKQITFC